MNPELFKPGTNAHALESFHSIGDLPAARATGLFSRQPLPSGASMSINNTIRLPRYNRQSATGNRQSQ